MNSTNKLFLVLALVAAPATLYVTSLYSACCGDDQRNRSAACPMMNCSYERGDKRCNMSSDCCPGKQCNSFGYCERCR